MQEPESKEVLLDKLVGMQDIEAAKQLEAMDTDLISECSGYIIELTGEEPPSEHVLEQKKQKLLRLLFGRSGHALKVRKGLLRKLLIAAIVIILIVAMSISMMPLSTNDESLIHRWGSFFLQNDPGYHMDYDDYLTLISGNGAIEYATIRQFIRKTHMNILVPTELPKGISVQKVRAYYEYTIGCPTISYVTNNPSICSFFVYLGKELDVLENVEKTERIAVFDCGVSITPGWCQCDFNYNGNGYSITAKTYEDLTLIINNLKGSLKK